MKGPGETAADAGATLDIVPFDEALMSAALDLWARAVGPTFPLREALLRQLTVENDQFHPRDAAVAIRDGSPVAFALLGRYRGDDPDRAAWRPAGWLTAIAVEPASRRRGIATRLYGHLVLAGQLDGLDPVQVRVGGGPAWLFPGPPDDLQGAGPFFGSLGFRFSTSVADVRADISGYAMPGEARQLLARHRIDCRRATGSDRDALLRFILEEFGLGWWSGADRFLRSGGAVGDWLLLTQDGRIVGMAHLHHAGQAVIGPARFWRAGRHQGGLGPIGIASSLRGLGLGLAFLHATLSALRDDGVDEAVADWTTLVDFYAKAGFTTWRTYATE